MHTYEMYCDWKKEQLSKIKYLPWREYGLGDQCYDLNRSHYDAHFTIWVTRNHEKKKMESIITARQLDMISEKKRNVLRKNNKMSRSSIQ